jgi:hypothetical protein
VHDGAGFLRGAHAIGSGSLDGVEMFWAKAGAATSANNGLAARN